MSSESEKRYATIVWASITTFLASILLIVNFIDAAQRLALSQSNRWFAEFLPDLAITLVVVGLAPLFVRRFAWRESVALVRRSRGRALVLLMVGLTATGMLITLWPRLGELYEIRQRRSTLDWHSVRALDLFGRRHYIEASGELEKALPEAIGSLGSQLKDDIAGRFKDAEHLIKRFRARRRTDHRRSFRDLLMVGRAVRLAPQAPGVEEALQEARTVIELSLAEYMHGVRALRRGQTGSAADHLRRSTAICHGLLHQEVLLRYAQNPRPASLDADEAGLIEYYLRTPEESLVNDLLTYPPVRQFSPHLKVFP